MSVDADGLLAAAKRPLVIGIGGGGDVVGALATAEACRLQTGARPIVGGVTWERRPVDPRPGPRRADEIADARPLGEGVLGCRAETRVAASGVRFAEARMAELLGEETVLVDVNHGPATLARGLREAMTALDSDLLVLIDVGGDVLGHGHEPSLASPLCDAVMLAAGALLQAPAHDDRSPVDAADAAARSGVPPQASTHETRTGTPPVLAGIFGIGCDGELTPAEVLERLAEVAAAGGLAGARGLTPTVAARLDEAVAAIPTEASAQALRCFRGEIGPVPIRDGVRSVELSPLGASTVYFDAAAAVGSAARLAHAVTDAADLDEANEILRARGVRTELDYERARAE
jgi:hypothetical protein